MLFGQEIAASKVVQIEQMLESLMIDLGILAGELYNASMHDTSMKIPAGGLLSTSTDLVRFAVAINKGKLLNKESVDSMWTHQKTLDGNSTDYGLGWKIESRFGRKFVSHTGG